MIRFASSITDQEDPTRAVDELLEPLDRRVTPGMIDLAMLFTTLDYEKEAEAQLARIQEAFPQAMILGGTAVGTIGYEREIEKQPSMSLLVGCLPDVRLYPFHFTQDDLVGVASHLDWERKVGVSPESKPAFIAIADPFRMPVMVFVDQLNEFYPQAPLLGGIASAARMPDGNMLYYRGEVLREGVVGVAMTGAVELLPIVSQGCRPIGKPFVVTAGEHNIIRALGGQPPLAQLKAVLSELSGDDMELAQQSLLMGRVIDEYQAEFSRGDFLIQNITGADQNSGALMIAGAVKVGSTVQFQVRDADSADEDLRAALAPHHGSEPAAALVFGCNGRGTHMWDAPHHDASVLREYLGTVPTAGMFCAGEFGPVGNTNFIHGFTASIALFRNGEPAGEDGALLAGEGAGDEGED